MKKKYWWVSVGGAACEPAVECDEGVFTLGCADPLNRKVVDFVKRLGVSEFSNEHQAPDTRQIAKEKREAEAAFDREMRLAPPTHGCGHGYRTFK